MIKVDEKRRFAIIAVEPENVAGWKGVSGWFPDPEDWQQLDDLFPGAPTDKNSSVKSLHAGQREDGLPSRWAVVVPNKEAGVGLYCNLMWDNDAKVSDVMNAIADLADNNFLGFGGPDFGEIPEDLVSDLAPDIQEPAASR